MIYGYARVSTLGQARGGNSLEEQIDTLKKNGARVIYKEAFTGTKIDRPEFDKLKQALKPGDTLIVTKLDRIARSASAGSVLIKELIDRGVKVNILNMGYMDNSPTGKLIVNVMFAFAEFERDMIVQRTTEGKERARLKPGYHEGRPKKELDKALFKSLLSANKKREITVDQACKRLGCSRKTWYNRISEVV